MYDVVYTLGQGQEVGTKSPRDILRWVCYKHWVYFKYLTVMRQWVVRMLQKWENVTGRRWTINWTSHEIYLWKCDSEWGSMEENERRSEVLEGQHSAKATGSVENKEFDSSQRYCTWHWALHTLEFSAKTRLYHFRTLRTRQVLHLQTSISSPKWEYSSKVAILTPLPRAREKGKRSSTRLQKVTSRLDTKSVMNVEACVWLSNVTISGAMMSKT